MTEAEIKEAAEEFLAEHIVAVVGRTLYGVAFERFAESRGFATLDAVAVSGAVSRIIIDIDAEELFVVFYNAVKRRVYQTAVDKGWHENERSYGEAIALMHSELSEALEAVRHGNAASDKIPDFSGVEEEYADVIVRIMDDAGDRGLNVAEALRAKIDFNDKRAYKHGGKAF